MKSNKPALDNAAGLVADGASESLGWKWLVGLFLLAFLLRIVALGRADLWCDEILFLQLSGTPQSPSEVWLNLWRSFLSIGHFPVPPVLQNAFMWLTRPLTGAGGADPFWVRVLAVLFGAATAPLLARFATLLGGRHVGLSAGLVFATFLYPVFFAREVYFYAPLAFFCLAGTYCVFRLVAPGPCAHVRRFQGLAILALGAASLSHVTGILLPIALLVVSAGWLLSGAGGASRSRIGTVMLVCLLGALPALPFYLKRMLHGSPMQFNPGFSLGTILTDGIGKQFLGTHPIALSAACVALLAGALAAFYIRDDRRHMRIGLLAIVLVVCTGVIAGSRSTLYFSRYFNAVNPLLYTLAALGGLLWSPRLRMATPALAGLLAVLHVVLFLPPMYGLPAKGVNYGGIARALVEKLPAGTPYVLESGYEMRFVPGYFATTNLVAACPYVHGGGDEEMRKLWAMQQRFFEQFPEAAYVESAHHGATPGSKTGVFQWPREHLKNRFEVRNEGLARLARWGIWPQAVDEATANVQASTTIYYNTPADIETAAKAAGRTILFDYPGWRISQVQQFVYARVAEAAQAVVVVRNLSSNDVTGTLRIPMALAAPAMPYQIDVVWQGQVAGSLPLQGGALQALQTGPMTFKPGANELRLRVGRGDPAQMKAIICMGAEFTAR